ncbi:YhbY family RNA-binding protein [Castellaniella defragrans]|uniref:RNA-binding protein n=2 Tax=Castellaniella defragrans TaxID=75697 RepID=A0A7W9TSH3_CASDE|nr:YhbY family RNA-binding protein [Castellaniella defragrans]MBB6084912.1 RNA-binding protein [Castellaniella defragrans]
MPKLELTSQQRSALRAAAHPLHPVVLIGDRGLTAAVLEEIDRTLAAHELIKIRVAGAERDARDAMLAEICETLSCAAVHHLGKTLIIYRPDPLAQQAAQAAENATRAVRRKSEPYVPKKQAAQPRAARPAASRRAAGADRDDTPARGENRPGGRSAADTGRPARPADARGAGKPARGGRADAGHGIPRRTGSGSALSLRAGARRGGRTGRG